MNNLESLYKIIKYVKKSDNESVLNDISPNNLTDLYYKTKFLYKQQGGNKNKNKGNKNKGNININNGNINKTIIERMPNVSVNKKFIRLDYHGDSNSEKTLTVPENMTVTLPLCCIMSHRPHLETFAFLNKSEAEKISIIEQSHTVMKINKQQFITLIEGETYCDINIDIRLEFDIDEGMIMNNDGKNQDDINQDDIFDNLIITDDDLKYYDIYIDYDKRQDKYVKEQNKIPNHDIQFTGTVNEEQSTCDDRIPVFILYRTIYRQFYKKYFMAMKNKITNINDETKEFLSICEEIINNSNDILKDFNYANLFKYVQFFNQDKIKQNKQNNIDNIQKLCLEIDHYEIFDNLFVDDNKSRLVNEFNIIKMVQHHNLHNYSNNCIYLFATDIHIKTTPLPFSINIHLDNIKKYYNSYCTIFKQLYMISKLSVDEKMFIETILSKPEMVNVTLSDILTYLKSRYQNDRLHIFNISCQGMDSEKVCAAHKCLKLMKEKIDLSVLNDNVTETPIVNSIVKTPIVNSVAETPIVNSVAEITFEQMNMEILIKTLSYIENNKLHADIIPAFTKEVETFRQKITRYFTKMKLQSPKLLSLFFVGYIYNVYEPMYDHIKNDKLTFEHHEQLWNGQIKIIRTILNLFISDVYNNTNSKIHKEKIYSYMMTLQ